MPSTSTPSATSALVWSWQGRAFDDPYPFVAHDNKIVTAFELVEHQNVTLMLRDALTRSLFTAAARGIQYGIGNGLQALPSAKATWVKRVVSCRLTRDMSGQTIYNTGALATVICTLPRLEAGLVFRFVDNVGLVAFMRAVPNGGNIIYGDMSSAAGGGGLGYLETAGKGMFELYCDGTNWNVSLITCSQNGLL